MIPTCCVAVTRVSSTVTVLTQPNPPLIPSAPPTCNSTAPEICVNCPSAALKLTVTVRPTPSVTTSFTAPPVPFFRTATVPLAVRPLIPTKATVPPACTA